MSYLCGFCLFFVVTFDADANHTKTIAQKDLLICFNNLLELKGLQRQ